MAITDFLQKLRMNNIFGNMGEPSPTFEGSYQTPPFFPPSEGTGDMMNRDTPFDAAARMRELFNPETESIDRYNEMIGQYPQYERPGMLKRIGAVALGTVGDLFGPKGSGQIAFNEMSGLAPHQRKVADWKSQIEPLERSANIERQTNTSNRQFATQTVANELRQRKDDATAAAATERNRIAQQRADVYEFKARNPGAKFDFSGPFVMVMDPATGQVRRYTDQNGNPIETGRMSEQDKIDLQQQGAIARIQESGEQARQTENVRQGNRQDIAETRGWQVGTIPDPNNPGQTIGIRYNEITGEVQPIQLGGRNVAAVTSPSQSGGRQGELPTQTRVREFNAARQLVNTRPELARWIKFGNPGTNDFMITPPNPSAWTEAGRGPTPEQYAEISRAIYGDASGAPPFQETNVPPPARAGGPGGRATGAGPRGSGAPTQGQELTKTQRNSRTGETRIVYSYDGGQTWTPTRRQ